MTDKELLELAAKAAGIDHLQFYENKFRDGVYGTGYYDSLNETWWNPITDDGDALRLAVDCGLDVDCYIQEKVSIVFCDSGIYEESHNDDPYAATRRAIVLAAAEIGKQRRD